MDSWGVLRDRKEESCSFPGFGFHPDSSAIALNHSLANSQSDAGAGVLLVAMEPFENAKDYLLIFCINAYAVVLHRKAPGGAQVDRRNVDSRRFFVSIFESVADEILK
jgi:hypothetical protein